MPNTEAHAHDATHPAGSSGRVMRSRDDRIAGGKALRETVPRESHASWKPPAERRDPLAILEESNRGRLPELVPIRHPTISAEIVGRRRLPAARMKEGSVLPTAVFETDAVVGYRPLIQIRSGRKAPADAFVAIRYGADWYWIDNKDFRSKSVFSFVMIIFSLTETGTAKPQPIVTIPAG